MLFDQIRADVTSDSFNYILESIGNDDLRDTFLDDPNAAVIGAENDPKINKFIESIPEDDELEPLTNKDIEKLTASTESYEDESDDEIDDYISSGNYDDIDDEFPIDDSMYSLESDDEIDDYISSGDYDDLDDECEPMSDPFANGDPYSLESDDEIDDYISSDNY